MTRGGNLKPFMRLDQAMVERGLAPSRSRAADAIMRGTVCVDDVTAVKPAQKVAGDADIVLNDPAQGYVSRAALKLKAALEAFSFDPKDHVALDIGSSTGGFTQHLLEREASHVFAVDVGHDQCHPSIRAHPAVTLHEGLNIRDIQSKHVTLHGENAPNITALVCDVSFISLRLALPSALALVAPGCWAALLVKPQFEVGRDGLGRGGIVRDAALAAKAAEDIAAWLDEKTGWQVTGLVKCPITGGDGNQEYMLGARFFR